MAEVKAENGVPVAYCPLCGARTQRLTGEGGTYFWECRACGHETTWDGLYGRLRPPEPQEIRKKRGRFGRFLDFIADCL